MELLHHEHGYPIARLCQAFGLSASGYHARQNRQPTERQQQRARLELAIKAAHARSRGTYGPEKLQEELADVDGIKVGIHQIKWIRRKHNLRCRQLKKYKATTNSKHDLPVAPNVLNQNFAVAEPNRVWVADITYIPTNEGWLYLTGIKDLCTGEIVGHAMADRMTQELVGKALFRAIVRKKPLIGLIHHSDRGSQYCSKRYQKLMEQFGMIPSMSRKGNCYDNAPMENFFGILKSELTHHRVYRTRQEAIWDITEYIEVFYNRQRRQTRLGFLSPVAYEKKLLKDRQVA